MFVGPEVDVPLEDTQFADRQKDATLVCKFHSKAVFIWLFLLL
mgnify:CR=1 FL=1